MRHRGQRGVGPDQLGRAPVPPRRRARRAAGRSGPATGAPPWRTAPSPRTDSHPRISRSAASPRARCRTPPLTVAPASRSGPSSAGCARRSRTRGRARRPPAAAPALDRGCSGTCAVAVRLHGELAHRDAGVRVHEHQRHYPGAVVEPAAVVLLHGAEPGLLDELFCPQRQFRGARLAQGTSAA
jgi:hypothetical protein